MIEGKAKEELADILISEDQLLDPLITIVRKGQFELATKIYKRNTKNLGAEIIAIDTLSKQDNALLGQLLMEAGSYEYSGILYERIGEYEKAGNAFKFDQDYSRASEAYDKAGLKEQSTEMRILFAQNGPKTPPPAPIVHKVQDEQAKIETEDLVAAEFKHSNPNEIELVLDEDVIEKVVPPKAPEVASVNEHTPVPPPPITEAMKGGFSIDTPTETDAFSSFNSSNEESTSIVNIEDIPDPTAAFKQTVNHKEAHSKQVSTSDNTEFKHLNWNAFNNADFLRDLTSDQIELLRGIARPYTYQENELILEYGQEPLGIYFILSGEVHIYKNSEQAAYDSLGPSETFGELWLLIDQPSNVQFVSHKESQVLTIKRADFNNLLDKNGAIARLLYKRFTSKLLEKLISTDNNKEKNLAS